MLTAISMGAAFLLVNQMNALAYVLGTDALTRDALNQAKQALTGYAAVNSPNRPGALPCPDLHTPGDTNEGKTGDDSGNVTCTTANRRVGRLPWKTLGLADLRDSSGERLWYALSDNLRYDSSIRVLNSNTLGTLQLNDDVDGVTLASELVAIVIAPGGAINGQSRGASGGANLLVANYLEGKNNYALDTSGTNDDIFVRPHGTSTFPRGQCLISGAASECNDRVLAITHDDLFSIVESVVARRMQTDTSPAKSIKQIMQNYYSVWGVYPYAVPFADPTGISDYVGITGTRYGLLPVTANLSNVTWELSSPAPQVTTTNGTVSSRSCTASTATQINCSITYCGSGASRVLVTITARLNNVGNSFYTEQWNQTDNPMTISTGSLSGSPSVSHTLGADGRDTVIYANVRLPSQTCPTQQTRTVSLSRWGTTVTAVLPPYDITTYNNDVKWFIDNEWYKLTYYALSPDVIPGTGTASTKATCSSNCLSLSVPASPAPTTNSVVLVLAGRALSNQARNTPAQRASLANYFELGNNQTIADSAYERQYRSASFNDKVVEWKP